MPRNRASGGRAPGAPVPGGGASGPPGPVGGRSRGGAAGKESVVRLAVRLTPRAAIDAVEGRGPDGELRVRVRAAPVDGAANEALVRLLAAELRVSRGAVRLIAGASGRRKIVEIDGLTAEALDARWPR